MNLDIIALNGKSVQKFPLWNSTNSVDTSHKTIQRKFKAITEGAVHKRRHQSRGRGGYQNIILFSKRDDEEGGGQKFQKNDDIFYE